jgi:hypothetical protein
MKVSHPLLSLLIITAASLSLATGADTQPLRLSTPARATDSVTFQWQGGTGPWFMETSDDLARWSTQGDLLDSPSRLFASDRGRAFYRLVDLNPQAEVAGFVGLLQTDQGEFGDLMARHRLKTRWWVFLPKGALSNVPVTFFRQLIVCPQFVEEGRVATFSGSLESLAVIATPGNAKRLTASWSRGTGASARSFVLTLDFPYNVNSVRATRPLLSDPTYALKCTYATPQTTLDVYSQATGTTHSDSAGLVEVAPSSGSDMPWLNRDFTAVDRGVQVNLRFREGLPLMQGSPPFIFKTYLLEEWKAPTSASGGSLPAFSTDSYFARTVLPGHHNFFHEFLLEPALDPALGENTRTALTAANIRYLYVFHDNATGSGPDDIRYIGLDGKLRDP